MIWAVLAFKGALFAVLVLQSSTRVGNTSSVILQAVWCSAEGLEIRVKTGVESRVKVRTQGLGRRGSTSGARVQRPRGFRLCGGGEGALCVYMYPVFNVLG